MLTMEKELLVGSITKVSDNKIHLPKEIMEELNLSEGKSVLVIYKPTIRRIILVPITNGVAKLILSLRDLPEAISEVTSILVESEIKTLYTTGMCYRKGSCVWEGFIDLSKTKTDLEELKKRLSLVEDVFEVRIDHY